MLKKYHSWRELKMFRKCEVVRRRFLKIFLDTVLAQRTHSLQIILLLKLILNKQQVTTLIQDSSPYETWHNSIPFLNSELVKRIVLWHMTAWLKYAFCFGRFADNIKQLLNTIDENVHLI